MTLKELAQQVAALLLKHPEAANAKVITEGCDCFGDAHAVVLDADGDVQITRPDGPNSWTGIHART